MGQNLKHHTKCLICDSTELKTLDLYKKAHLVSCMECSFTFFLEIPDEVELRDHYDGYGRNDYLSPVTIRRYHEILDGFEKYRKTNTLLDVGCGIGYFLEEAKKRGWDVHGTEFSEDAIRICEEKNIKVRKGKLDPGMFPGMSFDIITYFEVIEHLNNPKKEMGSIRSLLRSGGICYMTTPNFNSFSRYYLKGKYNVISYPEHLTYYTPKTLKQLFSIYGFKTRGIETTGLSPTRIKTSLGISRQQYIAEGTDDERLRRKIESNKVLKAAKKLVNGSLTALGRGDTIKAYFEKRS